MTQKKNKICMAAAGELKVLKWQELEARWRDHQEKIKTFRSKAFREEKHCLQIRFRPRTFGYGIFQFFPEGWSAFQKLKHHPKIIFKPSYRRAVIFYADPALIYDASTKKEQVPSFLMKSHLPWYLPIIFGITIFFLTSASRTTHCLLKHL